MNTWWDRREQIERVLIVFAAVQAIFFWVILPILIKTCVDHDMTYGHGFLVNFKSIYSSLQLLLAFGPILISMYLLAKKRWRLASQCACLCLLGGLGIVWNAGSAFQANKSTCAGFKVIAAELPK